MDLQDFTYSSLRLPTDRRFHLLKIQEHASAISRQLGNTHDTQTPIVKPVSKIPLWNDSLKQDSVSDTTSWHGSRFEVDTNGDTIDHDHLPQDYKPPKNRKSSSYTPIDLDFLNAMRNKNLYQSERFSIPSIPVIQPNDLTIQQHLDAIQYHAQKALESEHNDQTKEEPSGCGTVIAWIIGILVLIGLFNQTPTEQPQNSQEQGYLIDIPELIQLA
jgi:hypothetical protein